ncbi:MAG: hypothetical protein NTV88_01920 [Candidatus Micrarchaeota archaeon]|nr:hypothetical protein [Candidatus Micrarchaeota archaeon]
MVAVILKRTYFNLNPGKEFGVHKLPMCTSCMDENRIRPKIIVSNANLKRINSTCNKIKAKQDKDWNNVVNTAVRSGGWDANFLFPDSHNCHADKKAAKR